MVFKKPSNVRYTDMAIYVDQNAYQPDHDVNKIYEYLYHLAYMLAVKQRYFYTQDDYENFALMCASHVYRRLTNPKQFYEESNPKSLSKIKSCLNYMKKILYPLKVDYQQESYSQVINPDKVYDKDTSYLDKTLKQSAVKGNNIFLETEVTTYIQGICKTVRCFIKTLPYRNDRKTSKNIYISCLLTLLNQITWSRDNLKRLHGKITRPDSLNALIDRIYQNEQESGIILFHLEPSMRNYILVLVNEIKNILRKEIELLIGDNEPSEAVIKTIINNSIEDLVGDLDS